ncbi:MAG: cobalamin B12-binding domain-containing protein, partial [Hyphococcus sp.]
MRELDDVLRPRTERSPTRERALSAFFDLGEKLRTFYARGKQDGKAAEKSHVAGAVALSDTIEGEIIPRLMLAHEALECDADSDLDKASIVSEDDSDRFLQAILNDSATAAHQQIDALVARGVSRDAICLELMATTARRLGDMWDNDLCDFTQVTIGLCRLHEILRNNSALSVDADSTVRHGGVGAPRVLLSTACGDQHVFGVVMVAEFFREAGWA